MLTLSGPRPYEAYMAVPHAHARVGRLKKLKKLSFRVAAMQRPVVAAYTKAESELQGHPLAG